MSEPKNTTVEIAERVAIEARNRLLIPFLMKKLVSKAAWLAAPVVNPVAVWLVTFFIDVFYDEGMLLMFFGITGFQIGKQKEKYDEAKKELADQLNTGKELTDEEIKKASEEFDRKLGSLINFGN